MNETYALKSTDISWISRERRVLIIVICSHFALLLAMGLFRHWGNMSSLNDLGVFDQAVWGTLHGQWFLDTINTVGQPINWLSFHFNLFLLLFVPLYKIWPAAEWFAIAQALALSVAAWPIFLLASRAYGSERTGFYWALIYLLNPFLLSAAAWDFHPVTIAVPFIAGALLAIEKKDFRHLIMNCLMLLVIQEHFGLTVAGFGALWGIKHRSCKSGLLLSGIGLLHTMLVLGVIVPALSPTGNHPMIIDSAGQNSRYGWLGGSLYEIIDNITSHPLLTLKTIVSMDGTISYFVWLTLPFLGLFFASPLWLSPAFADLAANTLSANPMPRGIISYHSVALVPILTVSAIYGARSLARLHTKRTIPLTKLVLLSTLGLSYILAPLPLPGALNFWRPVQWIERPDPAIDQVRAVISTRSPLSVQANIGAHFSQHQQVYRYPFKVGQADTIVLWLDSPTSKILPREPQAIGTIAHHLQMNPATYLASIEGLLRDPNYGVTLWKEPWLVLSREHDVPKNDTLIRYRLDKLLRSWKITEEEYNTALKENLLAITKSNKLSDSQEKDRLAIKYDNIKQR